MGVGAYIKLDYYPSSRTRLQCKFSRPDNNNYCVPYSSRVSWQRNAFEIFYDQPSRKFRVTYDNNNMVAFGQYANESPYVVEHYKNEIRVTGGNGDVICNHTFADSEFTCVNPVYINKTPQDTISRDTTIYYMKISEEITMLNLRPCLYNGEYGLWDTISNTFYGNSGTGTITGGYDE